MQFNMPRHNTLPVINICKKIQLNIPAIQIIEDFIKFGSHCFFKRKDFAFIKFALSPPSPRTIIPTQTLTIFPGIAHRFQNT